MPFGICNEIFGGWSVEDTFKTAAEIGYDFVEIAPFTIAPLVTDISPESRVSIRELAARHQIGISGIHWVLAHTQGFHVTHPDAEVRRRTSDYLAQLVHCCADFGGTRMIVGSPKQRNLLQGVSSEQGKDWLLEVFREAVRVAGDRGVVICLEPLAPSETNFINTAAEAIELVKRTSHPAFQIILDVKAMSSEPSSIPDIIRNSAPYFSYFHANDRNLKGPGFGDVDYAPIVQALREVGYQGVVSVEVFNFEEGPEAIARRSLHYLHRMFGVTQG